MKTLRRVAALMGIALTGLILILLIKAVTFSSKQLSVSNIARAKVDERVAIRHLSKGIRIKTVTHDDPSENDYSNWITLRDYIETEYPLIHKNLERTIINCYSLLYKWEGTNQDKKPIILLAHMDVVPADPVEWSDDPFSGRLSDGVIWGRGAIDDKGSLFSILEAVEYLLRFGHKPERTIYLAFGHDEEAGTTGGMAGARKIAEYLQSQGIHAEFVMDEGLTIVDEKLEVCPGGYCRKRVAHSEDHDQQRERAFVHAAKRYSH